MAVVNGDRNNVSRATVPAPRTFVVDAPEVILHYLSDSIVAVK